jgi:hypothetical protein
MKRQDLIDNILDLKSALYFIRKETEDYFSISEYDSVYGDINEYEYNEFDSFKNNKELKEYIKYLRNLVEGYILNDKEW